VKKDGKEGRMRRFILKNGPRELTAPEQKKPRLSKGKIKAAEM